MTLVSQIEKQSGSLESLVWPIVVWDDAGASVTRSAALAQALTDTPSSVDTSVRDYDERHPVEQINDSAWRIFVQYRPANVRRVDPPSRPEVNTIRRRMQFHAKPETLWNFREPIAVLDSSGDVTTDFPNQKYKIDLSGAGLPWGRYQSHGHEFQPLPEVVTHDIYLPNASITQSYLAAIAALCGAFNDDEFEGVPAKSVQLVRVAAGPRSDDDWELSFGYGYKAAETSVAVAGGITIPTLNACDYYWTRDITVFDAGADIIETYAETCFVGRWGRLGDFSALGYPS